MHRRSVADWIGRHYGVWRDRARSLGAWAAALGLLALDGAVAQAAPPEVEAAVGRHLGLYSTVAERRDADETIRLENGRLEVRFLESLAGRRRERALCDGLRWLLVGRLASTGGAKALFEAAPAVEEIALVFYEVETRVEPDRNGRYTQQRAAVARARFTIGREKALRLDAAVLRQTLTGARCVPIGQGLVDELWVAKGR